MFGADNRVTPKKALVTAVHFVLISITCETQSFLGPQFMLIVATTMDSPA